jgi:hypothetical protein
MKFNSIRTNKSASRDDYEIECWHQLSGCERESRSAKKLGCV